MQLTAFYKDIKLKQILKAFGHFTSKTHSSFREKKLNTLSSVTDKLIKECVSS